MDECPTKKASDGLRVSRRGSNISLGDGNHVPRNSQCCNRLGCSINSMSGSQIGLQERSKLSRPNFRSSTSKAVSGGSSRQVSSSPGLRKAQRRPQTPPSSKEIYLASSSNAQGFTDLLDSSTSEEQSVSSEREEMEDTTAQESSLVLQDTLAEVCDRSVMHASRVRKRVYQRPNSSSHSFPRGSSSNKDTIFHHPLSSRHSGEPSEASSHGPEGSSSRYGLGNLSCASVSDVLPSRFSVADTQDSGRVRKSDGEKPSIRGKSISNTSTLAASGNRRSAIGRNMSFTSSPLSLQPTRRNIRSSTTRGVTSVRTRRMPGEGINIRLAESSTNNNSLSLSDGSLPPLQSQLELLNSSSVSASSSSSSPSSMDLPPFLQLNSFRRSESGSEISRTRAGIDHEGSSAHGFSGPSMDHGGYPRINMEGIAEEEYVDGDEVGHLRCDHCYHVSCIHVWLRLKNWCPVCKAPAAPE
ncbi:putative E3 ubiquitin-protein ligase [Nymphaea thermarum]|nr:putative E3 ubiquitin-protein ligase [Nymphaea thermarum]